MNLRTECTGYAPVQCPIFALHLAKDGSKLLLLVPAIVVLTIYLFTFTLSTPRSNNFLKHVLQRVACVLSVAISILVLADPEYFADFKSAQLNPPALLTAAKPYLILFNFFLIVFFYFVYQASPQADMEYAQWPIPHKYEAGPAIGEQSFISYDLNLHLLN